MTRKKELPIDSIDSLAFERDVKTRYLDHPKLDESVFDQIKLLYGLETVKVSCDEYHRHRYGCVSFDRPDQAIIERLILEVKRYQGKLSEIENLISKAKK